MRENSQHWWFEFGGVKDAGSMSHGGIGRRSSPGNGDHASCRTRIAFGDNHHVRDVASKVMATWDAGKPAIAQLV